MKPTIEEAHSDEHLVQFENCALPSPTEVAKIFRDDADPNVAS
jgi:hypothetical protein